MIFGALFILLILIAVVSFIVFDDDEDNSYSRNYTVERSLHKELKEKNAELNLIKKRMRLLEENPDKYKKLKKIDPLGEEDW